jgi:HEAT repeat protein
VPLPAHPDLKKLKHLARALQNAAQLANADALMRLHAVFPQVKPSEVKLSLAQNVIAREHGLPSWPRLVVAVEARARRRKEKDARAAAFQADAHALAESWFDLAHRGEFSALGIAMAVSKRRMLRAREVMQRDKVRYDQFLDDVIKGLSSGESKTRFSCAHMLDVFGDERCREPLVRLMEDPVPRVRWMAMHALSCHACNSESCSDDEAVRERIERGALSDESPQVRRHAVYALGLMKAPLAAETLRKIIAEEKDVQLLRAAKWALPKCEGEAIKRRSAQRLGV